MGRGDALCVEVFVEGFESLEGDFWVTRGVGSWREEARAKLGWVLGCACTGEAVVNDVLGARILVRGPVFLKD
jgi:hypothetical protein